MTKITQFEFAGGNAYEEITAPKADFPEIKLHFEIEIIGTGNKNSHAQLEKLIISCCTVLGKCAHMLLIRIFGCIGWPWPT